jgi:hypothetical protein
VKGDLDASLLPNPKDVEGFGESVEILDVRLGSIKNSIVLDISR